MATIKEFTHSYPSLSAVFTVAAAVGDVVIFLESSNDYSTTRSVSDNLGNTYTQRKLQIDSVPSSTGGTIWTTVVTVAGTITVSVNSMSDCGVSAFLVSGLTGNVQDVQGSNSINPNPSVSLTTTSSCSLFALWANEANNVWGSWSSPLTLQNYDGGHYDSVGYALGVAAGTASFGASSSASSYTILIVIAMAEVVDGSTSLLSTGANSLLTYGGNILSTTI